MNEKEFMKITGGIDERFVSEYENFSKTRVSLVRKKIRTVVAIAAAVAVMVPAGVYAYTRLSHREKVSIYYNEEAVKKMEEELQTSAFAVDNGQISLSVDVQMCDGNFTQGVYTLSALSEEAKAHLASKDMKLVYADTGERIFPVGGGFEASVEDKSSEKEMSWTFIYPVNNSYIDRSRPIRLMLYEKAATDSTEVLWGEDEDYTYYKGIYFDLLTEPNVPVKTLRSKDGDVITLSPYGVSQLDKNWAYPENEVPNVSVKSFFVIASDGVRTDVLSIPVEARVTIGTIGNVKSASSIRKGCFVLRFGTVFNLDHVSSVEINGVEYAE